MNRPQLFVRTANGLFPSQPSVSEWPVTSRVPVSQIEQNPLSVGGPHVVGQTLPPELRRIGSSSESISPVGPQPPPAPSQGGFAALSACPAGPQPGTEQFRFAKYYSENEAQQLVNQLNQPWPTAGVVTIMRWEDGKDHGFMGDQPNRTKTGGQGAHPDTEIYDKTRRVDVPAGTRAYLFTGKAFTGPVGQDARTPASLGTYYGPGSHRNIPNVKSMIVVPDVDFPAMINTALGMLKKLSCPASGCLINESNYETHPAVIAFIQYLDRVISLFSGHPQAAVQVGRDFEAMKTQLLADLARGVIANRQTCSAGNAIKPSVAQECEAETGERLLTDQQVATFKQFGVELTQTKDLGNGRGCYIRGGTSVRTQPAGTTKQCLARWSGIPGNAPSRDAEGRPFCITDPTVVTCQQRGGRLQAQILGSGARRGENMPVACLEPGGGMTRQGGSYQPGAQTQTFQPGQGYMPGGGGVQVQLRPVSSYQQPGYPGGVYGYNQAALANNPTVSGLSYGSSGLTLTSIV